MSGASKPEGPAPTDTASTDTAPAETAPTNGAPTGRASTETPASAAATREQLAGDARAQLEALVSSECARAENLALEALCQEATLAGFPSADTFAHLLLHRRELAEWFQEAPAPAGSRRRFLNHPEGYLAERCARWLSQRNQFAFGSDARPKLFELFGALRREVSRALSVSDAEAAPLLQQVFASARDSFRDWVRQRLGQHPKAVVSSEYSAALQLDVLGLEADSLLEPILDVGCGEHAELVAALRARGKRVVGIDQYASAEGSVVADWLTFPYESASWGSVLSHQAFALHFAHQHLANADLSRGYAAAYMRILQALAPGGCFAYAPSLPFFERLLPARQYEVTRRAVVTPNSGPERATIESLEQESGVALNSATLVRKLHVAK